MLLGLGKFLIKDMRKMVLSKLNKFDMGVVMYAHTSRIQENILLVDLVGYCAQKGYLSLLKWLHSECKFDPNTISFCWSLDNPMIQVLKNGDLEMLKWMHERGW